jgi:hypothetical protein
LTAGCLTAIYPFPSGGMNFWPCAYSLGSYIVGLMHK